LLLLEFANAGLGGSSAAGRRFAGSRISRRWASPPGTPAFPDRRQARSRACPATG